MRLQANIRKTAVIRPWGKCFASVDWSLPSVIHLSLHIKVTLSLSGCPLSFLDHFVQALFLDWEQGAGDKGMCC